MKRIMIATVLTLVAALQMMGQASSNSYKGKAPAAAPAAAATAAIAPVAKCTGPDGKPCTAAHVRDIATGMASGKRQWKPLETVKVVTLASADGTLKCEQNDGRACTAEQLDALNSLAGQFKCGINYNSSKSNAVNRSNIKNN